MAQKINVDATETIAMAAENCGSAIIYMSTNYVFDGKNPPFYPDSATNPLNSYGKMKLAGEKKISEICSKSIIIRIPILYGHVEFIGESTVTTIAGGISRNKESFFDNKQPRYPTHAEDIAETIAALAHRLEKGENIQGVYHCSSEKSYTKYQMAQIMAENLAIDPNLIKEAAPNPDAAPRPENAKLDTGRLKELGLNNHRAFEPAIRDILKKIIHS